MKTRQGVARRLAPVNFAGMVSVLGLTAGLAFGLYTESTPTGQAHNGTTTGAAQATGPATPQPAGSTSSSAPSLAQTIASFGGHKAFTRPWRDSVMGFSQSTRVVEIPVVGGQSVKKGDLIIRGEDEEEVARLVLQKMRAESTLTVDKAKKSVELALLVRGRYEEASLRGGTAELETKKAILDHEASIIDRDAAILNQDQEVIAVRLAQARLDRVRIVAPFDGTIDMISVDLGQSVNENDKVTRVVDTSILWVDVGVPTGESVELKLTKGGSAWALVSLPGQLRVYEGTIIEVSPVADPSSNTRRVRVQIQNSENVVAGVTTWVRFTKPGAEWNDRVVPAPAGAGETAAKHGEVQQQGSSVSAEDVASRGDSR
jgi:membrane fusion protein (multidrug efflux system)